MSFSEWAVTGTPASRPDVRLCASLSMTQAVERIRPLRSFLPHSIRQSKNVYAHKILVPDTVEERIEQVRSVDVLHVEALTAKPPEI